MENSPIQKIRLKGLELEIEFKLNEGWKKIEKVIYYQGLLYILEIISTKLISGHYNGLLARHLGIKKTWKLIVQKY